MKSNQSFYRNREISGIREQGIFFRVAGVFRG